MADNKKECPECGMKIPMRAKTCPYCGADTREKTLKGWVQFIFFMVALIGSIISALALLDWSVNGEWAKFVFYVIVIFVVYCIPTGVIVYILGKIFGSKDNY